jgi:hypothetical protein
VDYSFSKEDMPIAKAQLQKRLRENEALERKKMGMSGFGTSSLT